MCVRERTVTRFAFRLNLGTHSLCSYRKFFSSVSCRFRSVRISCGKYHSLKYSYVMRLMWVIAVKREVEICFMLWSSSTFNIAKWTSKCLSNFVLLTFFTSISTTYRLSGLLIWIVTITILNVTVISTSIPSCFEANKCEN